MNFENQVYEALCFNFKSIARLHGFESSWTFWKDFSTSYNFHVLSFFQIQIGTRWKNGLKFEKNKKFQHLENFLSMKFFDFLLTFFKFLIFYDHDGSFEVFWWWKKFCFEKFDQKSKFDFSVQMKFHQMFLKTTDEFCELLWCFESRN